MNRKDRVNIEKRTLKQQMKETEGTEMEGENQALESQVRTYPSSSSSNIPRFSWWWLASALAVGLVFGIGLLYAVRYFLRPLALLIIAIAIATAVGPLVQRLTSNSRIPRAVGAVLVFLAVGLVFVGIGFVLVPGLAAQTGSLVESLPSVVETVTGWLNQLRPGAVDQGTIIDTLLAQVGSLSASLVTLPFRVFSSLFDVLLILFIALYWVILMPSMLKFALSLFPKERQDHIGDILSDIGQSMGGYVRGTIINAVIVGLLTYIGLLIIGVPYAGVLGVLAGLLEIIPIIGPIIAGVVIVAFALLQSPTTALIAGIYMIIMQQLESNILVPNIMRREADVSPLLVLIAVYLGGTLGGLMWALAAIPLAAAVTVVVKRVIAPAVRKSTGAEEVTPS